MEGSTAEMEGRGDAIAMDVIRTHERLVRGVVREHGGREIKSMGDGFMIAFDDPEKGIECALGVQEALREHNAAHPDQAIKVRMGLNLGPVIEEGGDLYGTTVNATSRIAAKARSGQVLVSEAVRNASGDAGDWTFVDRGLFWLKGLRERWTLHEVTRGPAAVHAAALEGVSPFIDRSEERAALRRSVDAAIDGRGGLVLLVGEAGAGKTRLAEEVGLEASGRGMRLLVGRCYEASQVHPFAPFVDILEAVERAVNPESFRVILGESAAEIARLIPHIRRRFPDVPAPAELPDPEQARRFLFSSLRNVLDGMARQRPLYVVLDDLHFADEASLLFLEQLADELPLLPILVVGNYIQAELGASRPLQAMIETLHRRHLVERFQIGPLAEEDLASLLDALAGRKVPTELVRLLYEETEGNVFFAEEVARHLIEHGPVFDANGEWRSDVDAIDLDVPDTIRLTIGRRLEVLAPTTRSVLTMASVIGRAFGFELLEALSDVDDEELIDALDEAERAKVIASTSEGGAVQFRFSHELIRQTLLSDVSLTRRQLVHHRIADAIETTYDSTVREHAAAIAYHLQEAGRRADPAKTVRFLVMAGERALDAAAYADAERHFDRALALIPAQDAARAPVLEKLGTAERSLGELDDAMSTWREALDAYDAAGLEEDVARLCLDAGLQVAFWRRGRAVLEFVERGLKALGDRRTAQRGGLLALSGAVASQRGDYVGGEELLEQAVQIAKAHDDERILGLTLYSRAAHHFALQQFPQCADYAREAVEHLRNTADLWNLANALAHIAISKNWMGHYEDAIRLGEEASELALRVGSLSAWAFADRAAKFPLFARSADVDWYEQDGQEGVRRGEQQGLDWLVAIGLVRIGLAQFWRGDWTTSLATFEQASRMQTATAFGYPGRVFLTHAYLGNKAQALALIERFRPDFPVATGPNLTDRWTVGLMAAEAYAVIGSNDEAAALYPTVLGAIETGCIARGLDTRLMQTLAGITAGCGRRWDHAEEHFENALRCTRELPYRLEEPEVCRFYARMLLERNASNDRERAGELLECAVAGYSEIGMPKHVELAQALLRQTA
jgi:predicted ATPase